MAAPVDGITGVARAIENLALLYPGQFTPGFVQGDLQLLKHLAMIGGAGGQVVGMDFTDGLKGTLGEAQVLVWDHQALVKGHLGAQAITIGTHTLGAVKGKRLGTEGGERQVAVSTGQVLRINFVGFGFDAGDQHTFTQFERRLN